MRRVPWLLVAGVTLACQPEFVTPFGTTELVLDTNLPMPRVANRVRIDVFVEDAASQLGLRWISTKELDVRSHDEVPVSFSVFTQSETPARALVRIRVYDASFVRDYLGERFHDGDPSIADLPPNESSPRLLVNSVDQSPLFEPLPLVAFDRLVWVKPTYGEQKVTHLFLDAQCAGTMANLAKRESCTRTRAKREPAKDAVDEESTVAPETACTVAPRVASTRDGRQLFDEEICVPGGIYLMGTTDVAALTVKDQNGMGSFSSYGVRIAQIAPLLIDRYEVTVGRWRAAMSDGFRPTKVPDAKETPFVNAIPAKITDFCTYSTQPLAGAAAREDFPLNCVDDAAASEFCKYYAGELPTESQWEWVASSAGTSDTRGKRIHPWGSNPPRCDFVIFSRAPANPQAPLESAGGCYTEVKVFGPSSVSNTVGDVFPSVGVYGLGGNLHELMRDTYQEWSDECWATPAWQDPWCDRQGGHALRGGSWTTDQRTTLSVTRQGLRVRGGVSVGFRCVRGGR